MRSFIFFAMFTFLLAGCSALGKYIPSNFDNVEYGKLVELNVISTTVSGTWCQKSTIQQMNYRAEWLKTYSKYRLNDNIAGIYEQIGSITKELNDRPNPSEAYCRLKRQSIQKITTETLEVFGDRKA